MRKHILTAAVAAVSGGLAFGVAAQDNGENQPTGAQGLYSAEELLDAEVYLADDPDEDVGDVDDILLDDEMKVRSVVVTTGEILGLGGRQVVVEENQFTLESRTGGIGGTEHRLLVEAQSEDLENFPEYDEDWWEGARGEARETWRNNFGNEESYWQRTGGVTAGGTPEEFRTDDNQDATDE